MIHRFTFQNYRALRNVSIDLERLTVLVGPNASGKTSVLEGAYYLLKRDSERKVARAFADPKEFQLMLSCGAGNALTLGLSGSKGGLLFTWSLDRYTDGKKELEHVTCEGGGTPEPHAGHSQIKGMFVDYAPAVLLHLEMGGLAASSYSEEAVPRLESNGAGLASVLDYMQSSNPDDYREMQDLLRSVIPSVRAIRTPRAEVVRTVSEFVDVGDKRYERREDREFWGKSVEFDMEGAPGIPARMASEGTLLVLGVLTAIMGPDRPRLVLLDDMDRALHPKAQRELVGVLRRLLEQKPDLQIIATSHSPYLLDSFKPEEVRLTARKDDGSVVVARLTDHPEFEKWKEEMSPGEFWSLVGEKWVTEASAGEKG